MANKLLGSHWTMRIWRDGDIFGASFMCREYPHLNTLDTMTEGVEKTVKHYMFGGRAKVRHFHFHVHLTKSQSHKTIRSHLLN